MPISNVDCFPNNLTRLLSALSVLIGIPKLYARLIKRERERERETDRHRERDRDPQSWSDLPTTEPLQDLRPVH
jgi:hypothetical protein